MSLGALFRRKILDLSADDALCRRIGQAVSQWVSTFAEQGLGVTKTVGDLAGPMSFALLMGTARLIYGKFGDRLNLDRFMKYSCVLCMASYLCIVFVPVPFVGLLGCAVCGFSVGILCRERLAKHPLPSKAAARRCLPCWHWQGMGCSAVPHLPGWCPVRFRMTCTSASGGDRLSGATAGEPVLSDRETKKHNEIRHFFKAVGRISSTAFLYLYANIGTFPHILVFISSKLMFLQMWDCVLTIP
ncbi:MAG: MFS transporter [Ruminococcus callidus]